MDDHNESYRRIVESASDGILKLGRDGRVALASDKASSESVPSLRGCLDVPVEGGGCVLFVDDEPALRKLGKWILEDVGFEVVLIATGESAVAAIEANPTRFRAAVVDHGLPGLGGDLLIEHLRRIGPNLPVVQTSGYIEASGRAADVFLPKPYSGEDLQRAVLEAIAARAGH